MRRLSFRHIRRCFLIIIPCIVIFSQPGFANKERRLPTIQKPFANYQAKQVTSVILGYQWSGYSKPSKRNRVMFVKKLKGQWTRVTYKKDFKTVKLTEPLDKLTVKTALDQLFNGLHSAKPAYGLQTCMNHTDDYPQVTVSLLLNDKLKIRLASSSNCAGMTPWNVTDGNMLYTMYDEKAARAIATLLGKKMLGRGRVLTQATKHVATSPQSFSTIFKTLQHNLTVTVNAKKYSTLQLSGKFSYAMAALHWMDKNRYNKELKKWRHQKDTSPQVKAYINHLLSFKK